MTDNKSNMMVWHETITGNYKLDGLRTDSDSNRKEVTQKAVDNFMKKFATSAMLKTAMERATANP